MGKPLSNEVAAIVAVLLATLSFWLNDALVQFMGIAVLPALVVAFAGSSGPLTLRRSARLALTPGLAFASVRVVIDLVEYYPLGEGSQFLAAKGYAPGDSPVLSVISVFIIFVALGCARAAASGAAGAVSFLFQLLVRAMKNGTLQSAGRRRHR